MSRKHVACSGRFAICRNRRKISFIMLRSWIIWSIRWYHWCIKLRTNLPPLTSLQTPWEMHSQPGDGFPLEAQAAIRQTVWLSSKVFLPRRSTHCYKWLPSVTHLSQVGSSRLFWHPEGFWLHPSWPSPCSSLQQRNIRLPPKVVCELSHRQTTTGSLGLWFHTRVTSRVPQGSILGPLLYIVFMDTICRLPLSNGSKLIL